ncbi:MAG: hypothetical protein AUI83_22310 [Armatimonadetes bacterium 13_1_40CM_3_65_7]|nr:MAG: hypothetical protein AUI83_22310 [Armatimonadetes bacterium 13_1_40CM_3_65_7]
MNKTNAVNLNYEHVSFGFFVYSRCKPKFCFDDVTKMIDDFGFVSSNVKPYEILSSASICYIEPEKEAEILV